MCLIGLVLTIYTPMNEVPFPTVSITGCLISSVSVLSRTLEPQNHTFPTKGTTALYLPVQTMQTHTVAANKCKGSPMLKKLHQKIWKCHEILLCFQNIYCDKINKSLLWRISKKLSFLKGACFQWQPQNPLKIFRLPFLKGIRLMAISQTEFCDSIHHISHEQNPRTYYSWIPVNTIESNPVISAEAEGKALVYIGRSNLLKSRDIPKSMGTFLL